MSQRTEAPTVGPDPAAAEGELTSISGEEPDTRYAFGEFPLDPVRPGTALLVVSPTAVDMPAKRLLAAGNPDEGLLGIAARSSPRRFLHGLAEATPEPLVEPHVGVLGCMGSLNPRIRSFPEAHVRSVGNPADLTGVGMRFTDLYRGVTDSLDAEGRENPPVRVCLDSLTVLSQYVGARTLYRFLNAFNNRVRSAGMLGLTTVNRGAHDEHDLGRFAGLFDGLVEIRENEDGTLERRIRGLPQQGRGWQPA